MSPKSKTPKKVSPPPPLYRPSSPSLWSTVKEGLAFGTGTTIAREVVTQAIESVQNKGIKPILSECYWWKKRYSECRADYGNNCDDVLKEMDKACGTHPPLHFG